MPPSSPGQQSGSAQMAGEKRRSTLWQVGLQDEALEGVIRTRSPLERADA